METLVSFALTDVRVYHWLQFAYLHEPTDQDRVWADFMPRFKPHLHTSSTRYALYAPFMVFRHIIEHSHD